MKRRTLFIIVGVIAFFVVGAIVAMRMLGFGLFASTDESRSWEPMIITQANVASVLSSTNIIQDMPDDARIALYIGDQAYRLSDEGMSAGVISEPDVTILIPESYLTLMGQHGPCAAISTARVNGDLHIELHEESASLAWKYRSLGKYRSCIA